jgi:hypothetical protein
MGMGTIKRDNETIILKNRYIILQIIQKSKHIITDTL